jgi:hypothetical protein
MADELAQSIDHQVRALYVSDGLGPDIVARERTRHAGVVHTAPPEVRNQ